MPPGLSLQCPRGLTPVTVAFDARMALHSGIGRYIRNLTRALLAREPQLDLRLLLAAGQSQEPWAGLPVEVAAYDAPIYGVREQWAGSRLMGTIASSAPDTVWHVPHYNAPWRLPRSSVVTIHDLTHLERPDLFSRRRRFLAAAVLERATRRAGRLIAVSEATRKALVRRFPECESKVSVVHHGVEERFRPPDEETLAAFRSEQAHEHGLGRYLLFVGSTRGHKNLEALLAAYRGLGREDVALVLVGPGPADLPDAPSGVRALGTVDDEALPLWYAAAEALVLPSANEGFGLPALEALACGTPVVCSAIPALIEVVGDCARFIDPAERDGFVAGLADVLDDPAASAALRERGIERARRFRWDTAAEQTLDVYRSLGGGA